MPAVDVHNPTEVKYAIDDFLRQVTRPCAHTLDSELCTRDARPAHGPGPAPRPARSLCAFVRRIPAPPQLASSPDARPNAYVFAVLQRRQAVELQYAVAPSHTATDLHLFAGYAASLLACGGAGYNYYYPASRGLLAACIVGSVGQRPKPWNTVRA